MSKKVEMVAMELTEEGIQEVFDKGVQCAAEIEVGEAVECLLAMYEHIQDSDLMKGFKNSIGHEHDEDVDKFVMLLAVSQVATMVNNFKRREKEAAKA